MNEPTALIMNVLGVVLGAIVGLYVIKVLLDAICRALYRAILNNPKTLCDIDSFVGPSNNPVGAKAVLAHILRFGTRKAKLEPIPLEVVDSPFVKGLKVTRKAGSNMVQGDNAQPLDQLLKESNKTGKTPIVIATIRMGFGHHRLAYSAASWALQTGHPTLFHDLLNIESEEADLVRNTDDLYSRLSRYASELGGPVELFWGSLMTSGDADALRIAALSAVHLQPLLLNFPKDIPILCTHQSCALTAAAIGFTNVVNLVVDNYPQWFLAVPNTINVVQGPVNYETYLRMGIPAPKQLQLLGHWCPAALVQNIDTDCKRRMDRAKDPSKPIRILIPVGGAGAQRRFIMKFVQKLAPCVAAGRVHLFLNAGDHAHMKTAFMQALDGCKLNFDTVTTHQGVMDFQNRLLQNPKEEASQPVTLFCFDEYFPAVASTDILCRVSDVLACKPSELAFWCLPKIHIRRVGDHEGFSAKRGSELGDGTEEARDVETAMSYVDLFLKGPDLLLSMNQKVMDNHKIGIYHGCQKAVELCLDDKKDSPVLSTK